MYCIAFELRYCDVILCIAFELSAPSVTIILSKYVIVAILTALLILLVLLYTHVLYVIGEFF